MQLNEAGHMLVHEWHALRNRFTEIEWDEFIVMPNHIHGIVVIHAETDDTTRRGGSCARSIIDDTNRATTRVAHPSVPAQPSSAHRPTIGAIVGAFKSLTTVEYTHGVKTLQWPLFHKRLWQRNYYEHIIRDEASLNSIRQYIIDNPNRWTQDRENPSNIEGNQP